MIKLRKTAVITGASGGIGTALVKGYLDSGYQVIALDKVSPKEHLEGVFYHEVDLSEESELQRISELLESEYAPLDVLINNAAIAEFMKPLEEISYKDWQTVMDVNLKAAFFLTKQFVKLNESRPYGRVINMSSTRYHQNEPNWDLYSASKGGMVAMTNSLCVSLHQTRITVNAISPGWIATSHYDLLSEADHLQHPSGRVGKPEDVVRACLFLCDEKSDFINGANLIIDGGMTKKMIYL